MRLELELAEEPYDPKAKYLVYHKSEETWLVCSWLQVSKQFCGTYGDGSDADIFPEDVLAFELPAIASLSYPG